MENRKGREGADRGTQWLKLPKPFILPYLHFVLRVRGVYRSKDLERHSLGEGRRWLASYHKLSLQQSDKQLLQRAGRECTRDLAAAVETGSQVLAACTSPCDRGPAAVRQAGWRLVGRRVVI